STFHESYHTLGEATQFLAALNLSHPENIRLEHIGQSAEGRAITAVVISSSKVRKKKKYKLKNKPQFVLMGAQHAREWIATSTALYLAHALVANKHESWSMVDLLKDFDFYVIPMPNPDGYVYTWGSDRFWYKNTMNVSDISGCHGIDMNRNWGVSWEPSSSPNEGPCAAWYPGERPYQAPEVDALARYFQKLDRLTAFIDLRSYGQMISAPYSYSCDKLPPDAEDLLEAAHGAASAVYRVHGTKMTAGILCQTLYRAPGNIVDWMYVKNDVKYSYAVHLRDTGTYGYMLPASWIRPVGEETGSLVSYLAGFILKKGASHYRIIFGMRYY
ncbi:Zn-dependent exopeptidase, partial [Hysterangium stoloniferum]